MAVAGLSLLRDEFRRLVVDAQLLNHIVASLKDASVGVRAAACQCARALSRSANMLRTSLLDAGAAEPLFDLLQDEEDIVKITATATVSNLLIDFSPMKQASQQRHVVICTPLNQIAALDRAAGGAAIGRPNTLSKSNIETSRAMGPQKRVLLERFWLETPRCGNTQLGLPGNVRFLSAF